MNRTFIPTSLAIQSMRDNGYKSTVYAIAELVDNSIQAGATKVDILLGEKLGSHNRHVIHEIAILDNGSGMDKETMSICLQFGNGTRLTSEKQTGMGKFGMGLPAASVSQCLKTELYSWQSKSDTLMTRLDIDAIKGGEEEVPEPISKDIPAHYKRIPHFKKGDSGTIVIWKDLDRVKWKQAKSIITHSENLIGRMYRYFLKDGSVDIRFIPYDVDKPHLDDMLINVRPNDPLYLMTGTNTPSYETVPMFKNWLPGGELEIPVEYQGKKETVVLRASIAKESVREGLESPGSEPYGKHAKNNQGVSIVRAKRELDIDRTWDEATVETDRWWGIEVEFPPALDELFGVANNKQSASFLTRYKGWDSSGKSKREHLDELKEDDEALFYQATISREIENTIRELRKDIRIQKSGARAKPKNQRQHDAATHATRVTDERIKRGNTGLSDRDNHLTIEEKVSTYASQLEALDEVEHEVAIDIARNLFKDNTKFHITSRPLENFAFFGVKKRSSIIEIAINIDHPAYDVLFEHLFFPPEEIEKLELEEAVARLKNIEIGMALMLYAWGRVEDELADDAGHELASVQSARYQWGRFAKEYMTLEK